LGQVQAQKFFTKTGETEFSASVDTFEPIEAMNKSTTAVLNSENGQLAALLFVKAFHFEVALMQEHFNENYMESDQYPKATFKGKLKGFDKETLGENAVSIPLEGDLSLDGITKTISTKAEIKKEGETICLSATFKVRPQDYNIKIPGIVSKKIAESVTIQLHYVLVEKK
jgi:polyisoprenoid-binding protein YceI